MSGSAAPRHRAFARAAAAALLLCATCALANPPATSTEGHAAYATSIGFSPGVAQRIAAQRPELLDAHAALPATNTFARGVFRAYRGIHHVRLSGLRFSRPYHAFIDAGAEELAPESRIAGLFATARTHASQPFARPRAGQLYPGLLLRLELPGQLLSISSMTGVPRLDQNGAFSDALSPADVPDLSPFTSHIGFIGADEKFRFHAYEELYANDGSLTRLANQIDAQMAP